LPPISIIESLVKADNRPGTEVIEIDAADMEVNVERVVIHVGIVERVFEL
jgi:hypothetical protein